MVNLVDGHKEAAVGNVATLTVLALLLMSARWTASTAESAGEERLYGRPWIRWIQCSAISTWRSICGYWTSQRTIVP